MAGISIKLAYLVAILIVFAAAFAARRSPVDLAILLSGAVVGLVCLSIWVLEIFGSIGQTHNPSLAVASLIFSPLTVYGFAALFGGRYFFTDLTGWPRHIYLVGAIAGLAPILLLAGIALVFVVSGALR